MFCFIKAPSFARLSLPLACHSDSKIYCSHTELYLTHLRIHTCERPHGARTPRLSKAEMNEPLVPSSRPCESDLIAYA